MILPLPYRLATTTSSYVSILDRVPLESHFHLGNLTYQILIFIIMMMGRLGSRMSWPRLHYDMNNPQPTHTSTQAQAQAQVTSHRRHVHQSPPLSSRGQHLSWIYHQLISMPYRTHSAGPNISKYVKSTRKTRILNILLHCVATYYTAKKLHCRE